MKLKWRKWHFWRKVKTFSELKMSNAWMEDGNFDSRCPKCKQWESLGNTIQTVSHKNDTHTRTCRACKHQWDTILTPAGFVSISPQNQTEKREL